MEWHLAQSAFIDKAGGGIGCSSQRLVVLLCGLGKLFYSGLPTTTITITITTTIITTTTIMIIMIMIMIMIIIMIMITIVIMMMMTMMMIINQSKRDSIGLNWKMSMVPTSLTELKRAQLATMSVFSPSLSPRSCHTGTHQGLQSHVLAAATSD